MKKANTFELMTLIIAILVYSVMALAYMHSTFTSKDVLSMIVKKLDDIDAKVDKLYKPIGGE